MTKNQPSESEFGFAECEWALGAARHAHQPNCGANCWEINSIFSTKPQGLFLMRISAINTQNSFARVPSVTLYLTTHIYLWSCNSVYASIKANLFIVNQLFLTAEQK